MTETLKRNTTTDRQPHGLAVKRLVKCFRNTLFFIPTLLSSWKGIAINGELGLLPQIFFIVVTPAVPFALFGCLTAQCMIFIGEEFSI